MDAGKPSLHWAETSALLYLVIPLFIFFAGFIRFEMAIPACVLSLFFIYELIRKTAWREFLVFRWEMFYFLALAALWSWLAGGLGPLALPQNSDWTKHNLIIQFLAEKSWPASEEFTNFGELTLRYYIGWHLVPSLMLRITGASSAVVGSLWSMLGLFIFFNLLPDLVGKRLAIVAAPLVFLLFGGADFLGSQITSHTIDADGYVPWRPGYHYEWWARWAQFSSNTTAYFWCPNQALSAWLGAALLMRCRERAGLLPYGALLSSAILLWSPLVAIGLIPFLIALTVHHGIRSIVFDWRAIASVLLLALPVGLYLIAGSGSLPHGFIGTVPSVRGAFSWPSYFLFLAIEIGVPLGVLFWRKQPEQGFLIAAAILLCLIPLYSLGVNNDLVMRASLPALAVLAILCGKLFSSTRPYQIGALVVVLLAFPGVLGELTRGFIHRPEPRPIDLAASDEKLKWWIDQTFAPPPIWVLR